ncbi:hypothetical protein [Deinococcus marmoris]|uniref:hypothetical protein n=1 Tax=Deinococcus marmoris TaxID=249408 RepID=UPI00049800C9|nr:hypothetical protein [Deinococcus marmoris]
MKKMLTLLLALTSLNTVNGSLAAPMPQAVVVADSSTGSPMGYGHLLTESAWQGLALPAEVMAALGDFRQMTLTVQDLPDNVHVSLRPARNAGLVGLSVSRTDRRLAVHQLAKLTLTNSLSGYSYTVQTLVAGDERPEK